MARLPDPARSHAVLIGASTYQSAELPDLPAVRNNVLALATAFTDPVVGGSLSTWLTQRRVDITITVSTPDGRHITVDVRRARDPQAVTREIQSLLSSLDRHD